MSSTQQSGAAHWCKSVVEEVASSSTNGTTVAITPSNNNIASLNIGNVTATPMVNAAVAAQALAAAAPFAGQPQYQYYLQYYYNYYANEGISNANNQTMNYRAALLGNSSSNVAAAVPPATQIQHQNVSSPWATMLAQQQLQQQQLQQQQLQQQQQMQQQQMQQLQGYTDPAKRVTPSRFTSASSSSKSTTATATPIVEKQPTSLKEFVKRSFAQCSNDFERQHVSKELNKLIEKVTAEGRLSVHRWDLEPTPLPDTAHANGTSNNSNNTATADAAAVTGKKRKSRWDEAIPSNETPSNSSVLTVNTNLPTPTSNSNSNNTKNVSSLVTPEEMQLRMKRANRFQDDDIPTTTVTSNAAGKKDKNSSKKRKGNAGHVIEITTSSNVSNSNGQLASGGMTEWEIESLKIVGTCQKLEKDYFRLTSPPLAHQVRPENILRKSIQLIKKKWENDEVDYVYMCSQLKSIRQDLTVQHIKNDFTVHVYETHARVALECSDINEYNQCQTQLKQLYAAGLVGNEMEFIAYRILYYVYLQGNKKYTAGSTDMAYLMMTLTANMEKDPAVQHALQVRAAVRSHNYHQFFTLYRVTPNMGSFILDMMLDSLRLRAIQRICKAYNPSIAVISLTQMLAFEDEEESEEFLQRIGCVIEEEEQVAPAGQKNAVTAQRVVMTKKSDIKTSAVFSEEKSLL